MKKLFLILSAVGFLLACSAPKKSAQQRNALNGTWRLAVFLPQQKKPLADVFGDRVIELQFNTATNGVSGTTGCNRFAGTFTADTAQLHFSENRVLTKMACGTYNEQTVLTALDRINLYRIVESQLELLENDTIILIFAKKPD